MCVEGGMRLGCVRTMQQARKAAATSLDYTQNGPVGEEDLLTPLLEWVARVTLEAGDRGPCTMRNLRSQRVLWIGASNQGNEASPRLVQPQIGLKNRLFSVLPSNPLNKSGYSASLFFS